MNDRYANFAERFKNIADPDIVCGLIVSTTKQNAGLLMNRPNTRIKCASGTNGLISRMHDYVKNYISTSYVHSHM